MKTRADCVAFTKTIVETGQFELAPILADMMEDAGFLNGVLIRLGLRQSFAMREDNLRNLRGPNARFAEKIVQRVADDRFYTCIWDCPDGRS